MILETPAALWLFPAGVLTLLLLQLWQARRHELLVGSLIVWRRVAEQERARPRRRLVLDRSFWLQVAALLSIALAWANPMWTGREAPGRRFVVVLDNGSSSRFRETDGQPVWTKVQRTAEAFLRQLNEGDRVILCTGVPLSKHLPVNEGVPPTDAVRALSDVSAGLSSVQPEVLWRMGEEEARLWSRVTPSSEIETLVFSVRASPFEDWERVHWVAVPTAVAQTNVALTAFGTTDVSDPEPHELLIQIRNFGARQARGQLRCEERGGDAGVSRDVEVDAGGVRAEVFSFRGSAAAIQVSWHCSEGTDPMPEDDSLTLVPRLKGPLHTRWHGTAPHLQTLYRKAFGAEEIALDSKETADLDIFVEGVPSETPSGARALLLLAPPQGYGPFDVLPQIVKRPVARLGDPTPLMRGLVEGTGGLDWPIGEARALHQVGDLRTLALDDQGNILACRFTMNGGGPGYAFAFVPGEGLGWAPERPFDSPGLAAVLLRVLREAAGADQPLACLSAEALERSAGRPLPLDWRPAVDAQGSSGQGVLNPRSSNVTFSANAGLNPDLAALVSSAVPTRHSLWPLLTMLAILLVLADVRRGEFPRPSPMPQVER